MSGVLRTGRPAAVLLAVLLLGSGCAGQRPAPGPGPGPGPDRAPEEPGAAAPEEEAAERPAAALPADRYYWAYVASDGPDMVSRLRFGPDGAVFEKAIPVGTVPDEPDGVGELALSPDGSHWFLTLGGGATAGGVWKFETGSDRMLGQVRMRGTPASLALAPDGRLAYVTVGPPGGTGPATVSVLRAGQLAEAARMATCREGRASQIHPGGEWQYSVCQADDLLVEVAAAGPRVSRTVRLSDDGRCGPVDLALSPEGDRLYVPCAASGELLVLDREELGLRRRVTLEGRPVDVEVTPRQGRVLVLLEEGPSLAVLEPGEGEISARIPLSTPRPTSMAVSDDGRYAFVALRGRPGSGRSTVELVDLTGLAGVATVEVPEGATSTAFWRSVARR